MKNIHYKKSLDDDSNISWKEKVEEEGNANKMEVQSSDKDEDDL